MEEISFSEELSISDTSPESYTTPDPDTTPKPDTTPESDISNNTTININVGGKHTHINKKLLDAIMITPIKLGNMNFLDRDYEYFEILVSLLKQIEFDKTKLDNLDKMDVKLLADLSSYGIIDKIYEPQILCLLKKRVFIESDDNLIMVTCNEYQTFTLFSNIQKSKILTSLIKTGVINLDKKMTSAQCRDVINCLRYNKIFTHNNDILDILKKFDIQIEKIKKLHKNLKMISSELPNYCVKGKFTEQKIECQEGELFDNEIKYVLNDTKYLEDLWLILDFPMTNPKLIYSENFEQKIISKIYYYNTKIQVHRDYESICQLNTPILKTYTLKSEFNNHKDVKRISINIYDQNIKNYEKIKLKIILNDSKNYNDYKIDKIYPYTVNLISNRLIISKKLNQQFLSYTKLSGKNKRLDDYISEVIYECNQKMEYFIVPEHYDNIIHIILVTENGTITYNNYYNSELRRNAKYFHLIENNDQIYIKTIKIKFFEVNDSEISMHCYHK